MLRPGVYKSQAYRWGAAALFLASGSILTALGFEHLGGMKPCQLCLEQRWAYYLGVPATFAALVLLSAGRPQLASGLFVLIALGFLANAGLGAYHAGVEWGYWLGPDTCSGVGGAPLKPGNMLDMLKTSAPVIRCDAAQGRFAGLSFAGWNVIACLMLSTATSKAASAARDHETYL
jgi:disulfide bond formation protein DsbB